MLENIELVARQRFHTAISNALRAAGLGHGDISRPATSDRFMEICVEKWYIGTGIRAN